MFMRQSVTTQSSHSLTKQSLIGLYAHRLWARPSWPSKFMLVKSRLRTTRLKPGLSCFGGNLY